ncbi:hypothetical protein OAU57_01650 [Candidatus Pelagibacter ubique]|nr:hypothetical protein [Candidatus Pelagibacter ubique]|tara:strand:- start:92 stop:556 length:465 start_codon:yes stop_codon:yes gene_type:complete
MKKFLGIILLGLLLSINAHADIGDTYTCTTEKISQLDSSKKITTDFKSITFSLKIEKLKKKNDNFFGKLVFGKSAYGTLLEDKLYPLVDYLFIRTNRKPERVMAHSGNTHAWFDDGRLTLSSHFISSDNNPGYVYKLVSSISNCKKNKPKTSIG